MKRKLVTEFDIILITFIVLICILVTFLHFNSNVGKIAVVSVNEQTVVELDLNADKTERIETDGGYNIITIKNGKCTVTKADCRDGICVKHSAISKVGQSIVCLPHKLIVEIK